MLHSAPFAAGSGCVSVSLLRGDAAARLRELPDGIVNVCVTSPPYFNLRNNQGGDAEIGREANPDDYVRRIVEALREVWRVLRGDGSLWLVMGDGYARDPGKGVKFKAASGATYKRNRQAEEGIAGCLDLRDFYALKPKDLLGVPWLLAFALRADGWWLREAIVWAKDSCMPESVRDRCTSSHDRSST